MAESMRGGFCCRRSDRAMVCEKRKRVFCVTNLPVGVWVFSTKQYKINMSITGAYVGIVRYNMMI